MLSYCLKWRTTTESKNPRVAEANEEKLMLLLKCAVCDSRKARFSKEQEAYGLLSSLGIKSPLSKILL